jgi:pimeloyl-ACP methyl ester carboxylesterase
VNIGSRLFVRAADADLLDSFLVSAIATVVIIRIFLEATGYPQLGGGGLHIAHVLGGGLGMLVAIVLLLLYLTPATRLIAAEVGGVGFGAFVDELGKFVTSDNDYFFKPTGRDSASHGTGPTPSSPSWSTFFWRSRSHSSTWVLARPSTSSSISHFSPRSDTFNRRRDSSRLGPPPKSF